MQDVPPISALTLPPNLVAEVEVAAAEDQRLPQEILQDAVATYVRVRRLQRILKHGRKPAAVLALGEDELGELIIQSRVEMRQRA
jgi:hypothetical protein